MNKENVQAAINVMLRVKERNDIIKMNVYSGGFASRVPSQTEEGYHACGNTACFAGWLAVSAEWRQFGGSVSFGGRPLIEVNDPELPDLTEDLAVAEFLDIAPEEASAIVYGEGITLSDGSTYYLSDNTENSWPNWDVDDVLCVLYHLTSFGTFVAAGLDLNGKNSYDEIRNA